MVVSWPGIRVGKGRVLEGVGVDDQSSPAGAPAQEVVPRVADDEPQIVGAGEVDACFHVVVGLCKDDIDSVVAKSARRVAIARGTAGLVGIVGPQGCRGLVGSVRRVSVGGPATGHFCLCLDSRPLSGVEIDRYIRACGFIIRADVAKWALIGVVADSPRRNMDGQVAIEGGV